MMKTMTRRALLIGMMAALLAPLAACGRKSLPRPPEGATYPRQYPAPRAGTAPSAPPPRDEDEEAPERESPIPSLPTLR
jgi:hypothetical protein